jgi:hypothetical protein
MIPPDNPMPALLHFVATWVPDLLPNHGIAASTIPTFIPPPLREIYKTTGNWPVPNAEQWRPPTWHSGLFGTQDRLLPLDQLVVKGNRFTFIHENQGVWTCETFINEADPPVFSDASSFDDSEEGMREVCPYLSHFLSTFCLHELLFGSKNLFCVDSEPGNPRELVTRDIEPLWLDGMYAYSGAKYSFFLCDRNVMIMHAPWGPPSEYWLAYNNEEAAQLLDTKHEIRRIH